MHILEVRYLHIISILKLRAREIATIHTTSRQEKRQKRGSPPSSQSPMIEEGGQCQTDT